MQTLTEGLSDGTLDAEQPLPEQTIAERLVRAAIRAYRLHPFNDVDAAVVADVAGLPLDAVSRAFPTWDALLLVTYDRWTAMRGSTRRRTPTCTVEHVRQMLAEDVADPGRVRVLAGVINMAGAGTSFADLFRKRYQDYVVGLAVGLQRDVDAGIESIVVAPERAATQLLAVYEGLQVQMLVRPHLDALTEFEHAVRALREGWRRRHVPAWDLGSVPAWDLGSVPTSPILPA